MVCDCAQAGGPNCTAPEICGLGCSSGIPPGSENCPDNKNLCKAGGTPVCHPKGVTCGIVCHCKINGIDCCNSNIILPPPPPEE
jgi:hypothetical protein